MQVRVESAVTGYTYNDRGSEMSVTVEEFAALVQEQVQADLKRRFPGSPHMHGSEITRVVPGPVYTKVDVGPPHNMSGRYMVENETGCIFGIKGYGRVHKAHRYGTLATVTEWFWGGYGPAKIPAT
jgi:hypothetical protein